MDAWFFRPDKYSTGGVGLKLLFLQVCFTWGREKRQQSDGKDG